MALSEYMPYGAPELLDGASGRMARSTIFASLAVATFVCGLGAILSRDVTSIAPAIEPARIFDLLPDLRDPPAVYRPTMPVQPARPSVDPASSPILVPDDALHTPERFAPAVNDDLAGPSGGDAASPHGPIGPVDSPAKDPAIGDVVIVDVYPNLVTSVEPVYPDLAREAGVEGVVRVLMLVGLEGRVERVVVAPGGSVLMLDDAALAAARASVFTPALTNDHPVKVWVSRSYRFSLH
jgi:TonB family protein